MIVIIILKSGKEVSAWVGSIEGFIKNIRYTGRATLLRKENGDFICYIENSEVAAIETLENRNK